MRTRTYSLKGRLNLLLVVCFMPFTVMIVYLVTALNQFSTRYDGIVKNITTANEYVIDFKEEMDDVMYSIVINGVYAQERVDLDEPFALIQEVKRDFDYLDSIAEEGSAKNCIASMMRTFDELERSIRVIESKVDIKSEYVPNLERLDTEIYEQTTDIQETIQRYIYYETMDLDAMRSEIRAEVSQATQLTFGIFAFIIICSLLVSQRIVHGITMPIMKLSDVASRAGKGDFRVRMEPPRVDELAVLHTSFNKMLERIGHLVEDIRIEQLNLRATELRLLQAQINPHFLYNTLDAIIWLAEAGQKEQVVKMVSSLSEFFRTTLSKGEDYISVQEEESHIRSYLEIQQFRYRDILEYQIDIPRELYDYQVLKLMLQPLVENALYHGIKNKRGMGKIHVTGEKSEDKLIFRVEDNGIGMRPKKLEEVRKMTKGQIQKKGSDRSGFALSNVEERISLNYGKEYGIQIESEYNIGTVVTVSLPLVKK